MSGIQLGVFSVGDITPDPTTGRTPTQHERIKGLVEIGKKAEEVGFDVFAVGEHHDHPFVPSALTTLAAFVAAQTERIVFSTSIAHITTNDPVLMAEQYAFLQHLSDGRVDLVLGRGNTGPVYPWFGKDIRDGMQAGDRELRPAAQLWRTDVVDWQGKFRTPLQGFTSHPAPARRRAAVRLARVHPQPRDRRTGRLLRQRLLPQPHLLAVQRTCGGWSTSTASASSTTATARRTTAIVGLGGQVYVRPNSQDAVREFRPYFDVAPVYGHGPSLEEFMEQTPLTVGSPQQVIERTLAHRELVGDYQRQMFLLDHAGLPLKTVLEQMDLLGEHVLPALREGFAQGRPAHVPGRPDPRLAASPRARAARRPARRDRRRCPHDPAHHRRQRRPERDVLDPPPGRPAGRRDDRGAAATGASQAEVTVIDLRERAHDITNATLTGFAAPALQADLDLVLASDGVVAATPVYSGSYTGLFKSFVDLLGQAAFDGTPVLLAATAGTARHSLAIEHAHAPAVQLPASAHRPDRGVRRERGLGR